MRCCNSRYCSDLQLVKISKKSFKANFSRCRILLYCKYRHAENIIKRFVYGSKTRIDWALKKSYTENRSLKCGIAENVDFRKCRISARASQRACKREVSSGAQYIREFSKENSKLNWTALFQTFNLNLRYAEALFPYFVRERKAMKHCALSRSVCRFVYNFDISRAVRGSVCR